ncbi:hypothetical protein [Burkholderia savannae]|uniref:hypothetical protein n=1 Tax=Burkholderia savannae TaxID=1637837 RepID=UPI0009EA51EB|nr:hypothetical protein [Burkholderia savannae]
MSPFAHFGRRAHDRRDLIAPGLQRMIERRSFAIRRRHRRKREHAARDMRAVRRKEAVIVRVHPLVIEPVMNRVGGFAVRHRIALQ